MHDLRPQCCTCLQVYYALSLIFAPPPPLREESRFNGFPPADHYREPNPNAFDHGSEGRLTPKTANDNFLPNANLPQLVLDFCQPQTQ